MEKKKNLIQDKSYELALKIILVVRKFPQRTDGFVMGRQLLRSGTSIGANVEEAIAACSKADFLYKMNIALKEARETHYWLRLIRDTQLIECDHTESLLPETEEVMRILGAIVRTIKKQ